MSAQWYKEQPTNRNFLNPIGYLLKLEKFEGVDFFCQTANVPDITMPTTEVASRFRSLPIIPGGGVTFGDFVVRFIVDEDYCLRTDTYNVQPASGRGMGFCNTWYHDPITQQHVRANIGAEAKMKRLGFVKGRTYAFIKRASEASRGIKMWYNNKVVKASGNEIDEILSNGGEFINKRIWMHKPGQRKQSFLKGANKNLLRPQAANIEKVLAYRDAGWEWGLETI